MYHTLSTACLCAFLALGCASSSTTGEPDPSPLVAPEPSTSASGVSDVLAEPSSEPLEPIYFDTDRARLSETERAKLKRYAQVILEHTDSGLVTILGHCDERGSEAYNLALGKRRATVVSNYLKNLGVPASRLQTFTRGEMQPAFPGHDESVWSLNRRAVIEDEGNLLALR